MRILLSLLLLPASFPFVRLDDDANAKYIISLKGSYKVVSMEDSGVPESAAFLSQIETVSIDGERLTMTTKTDKGTETSSLTFAKLDASKTPVHIDLKGEKGPFKGEIAKGIIVVEKDTVKLCCANDPKAERPTEFKTKKGDKSFLIVIKRVLK